MPRGIYRRSAGRSNGRGMVEVTFLPQGGSIVTVSVKKGSTLKSAIEKAGFDPDKTEARNGDLLVEQNNPVRDCMQLVLLPEGKVDMGTN